jgi:hypothetical protein
VYAEACAARVTSCKHHAHCLLFLLLLTLSLLLLLLLLLVPCSHQQRHGW